MTTLSNSEIESLRFHLGYGNVTAGAYPYTPDGFLELFSQVIAPNLPAEAETSSTTAVTAIGSATITVASITGIAPNVRLIVDVGDDAEIVVVSAIASLTMSARFAKLHAASGYPVAVESGLARCRYLLHTADRAWQRMQDVMAGNGALKKVDEIEFYQNGTLFKQRRDHYNGIVQSIASLVRVPVVNGAGGASPTRVEAY